MLRAVMCAAGPEQMLADASFAVAAGATVEPVARPGAGLSPPRRTCSAATSSRPVTLFAEASTVAVRNGNTDAFVICESELALVAMDRGRWAEATDRIDARSRHHR